MRKMLSLVLVLVLGISGVMIACGGDEENETTPTITGTPASPSPTATAVKPTATQQTPTQPTGQTAEPSPTAVKPTTEPTTPTAGGGDSDVVKLLKKGEGVKCFEADMVISNPGQPEMTATIWKNNQKYRMEMQMQDGSSISLVDVEAGVAYVYNSFQDQWMKVQFDEKMTYQTGEEILECDPKIVGSETMDGKACTVVEYACEGIKSKVWIWNDKGLPVKEEVDDPDGKTVVTFKNFDFNCAASSLFELPAGANVVDMEEMMQGLEGLGGMEGFEPPEGIEIPEGFPMPQ